MPTDIFKPMPVVDVEGYQSHLLLRTVPAKPASPLPPLPIPTAPAPTGFKYIGPAPMNITPYTPGASPLPPLPIPQINIAPTGFKYIGPAPVPEGGYKFPYVPYDYGNEGPIPQPLPPAPVPPAPVEQKTGPAMLIALALEFLLSKIKW